MGVKTPQMVEAIKLFLVTSVACIPYIARGQGVVIAEKNCAVRIEGASFNIGDKVSIFRNQQGKKTSLALISITKIIDNAVLGKVIKIGSAADCSALYGARTELFATATSGNPKTSVEDVTRKHPKIDPNLGLSTYLLSCKAVESPLSKSCPGSFLTGFLANASVNVFPLLYKGDGFIHKFLGIGAAFSYGTFFTNLPITTGSKIVGNLASNLLEYELNLIGNFFYSQEKMVTEIKVYPMLTHKISHEIKADSSEVKAFDVLFNLKTTGQAISVTQKYWIDPSLSIYGGVLLGVNQAGEISLTSNPGKLYTIRQVFGFRLNGGADMYFPDFKLTTNAYYSDFGGSIETLTREVPTVTVKNKKFAIFAGAGFNL